MSSNVENSVKGGGGANPDRDVEKLDTRHRFASLLTVKAGETYEPRPEQNPKWYQRLLDAGVEENGIKPVPLERRTSTQYSNLFTIFFTSLLCLLP